MVVVQKTINFPDDLITITNIGFWGICECGRSYESNKYSFALKMYIRCKHCGELIQIGDDMKLVKFG
jgi:hypothetical protein